MLLIATEVQAKKEPLQIIAGAGLILNQIDPHQKPFFAEPVRPATTWGLALMAKGQLNRWFEVEANISVARFQFIRESPSQMVYERSTRFHVPVLLRFRPWHFLSMGLGPYASYRMGSVSGPKVPSLDSTSAFDMGEHGLEAALGFTIPIPHTKYMIGIDGRYYHTLTPRPSEKEYNQALLIFFQSFLDV